MEMPKGIAKFDSASAMTQALARYLDGRDLSGLGQSAALQALTRGAGWVPRRLRERLFAHLGALGHINAALGISWLGQTFLTLVDQKGLHADDAIGAMEAGKEPAARFLAANPGV